MTTQMTVSFAKGKKSETSIHHNNRSIEKNFDYEKRGHRHINPELTHMNEVLIHDNIRDVYREEFGQAVDDYNAKQKRKDRKIDDYYDKIKRSKTMRTQYEFIAQIGNKDNWDKYSRTSKQWSAGKKMLEKYYDGFSKRNPNLRVYNASIHMDEKGSPHLHLNVVPIARGYKQGVKVRPAFDKALKEQGIPSDPKDSRALFRNFQKQEQQALADIADSYGIERVEGITNKLRDIHEYKEAQQIIANTKEQERKQSAVLDKLDQKVFDKQLELNKVSAEVNSQKLERDRLREENKRLRERQEFEKKQAQEQEELRQAVIEKQDREIAEKKKLLEKLEEKAKAFRDRAKRIATSVVKSIKTYMSADDSHELLENIAFNDTQQQLEQGISSDDLDFHGWADSGLDDDDLDAMEHGVDSATEQFENPEKDVKQAKNSSKNVDQKKLEEQYRQYLEQNMDM